MNVLDFLYNLFCLFLIVGFTVLSQYVKDHYGCFFLYQSSLIPILLLLFIFSIPSYGQEQYGRTRLYKRIMIVEGGNKSNLNDDAHYITFNKKGFYDSDSQGNTLGGNLISFEGSTENYHYYEGILFGVFCKCYFSKDYSRLNIKTNDRTIVYQRESSNTTTASWRSTNNPSSINANPSYFLYPQSHSSPSEIPTSKETNKTERICPLCHGCGKYGDNIVYRPDYTGNQANEYCSICGRTTTPHSHREKMCTVCKGRGKIR